jgi:hypothetical protein
VEEEGGLKLRVALDTTFNVVEKIKLEYVTKFDVIELLS